MSVKYTTIDNLAKTLSVSVSTIGSWLKRNIIPKSTYIKVGSTYRFDLEQVIESLKNYEVNDDIIKVSENTNPNNENINKKYISVLGSFLRKLSDGKTKNQLDVFFKKNTN